MRLPIAAALLLISGLPGARAADLPAPGLRAAPVRTVRAGTAAEVLCPEVPLLALERSRFTGQPLTVVYNDPGRAPDTVVPDIALVPLPRGVRPFHTKSAYPRGY